MSLKLPVSSGTPKPPVFFCNKCGYLGPERLHNRPGFAPPQICRYEAVQVPTLTVEEAEAAVLAVADDWYEIAHSDNVNIPDWKKICERMDKAVQTLRKARAAGRLAHPAPDEDKA